MVNPAVADIEITKGVSPTGTVAAGSDVTYTITVANKGAASTNTYTLTDAIPSNFTRVRVPTGCTFDPATYTVTCANQTVPTGAATNTYVILATATSPGPTSNKASVSVLPEETVTVNNDSANTSGPANVTVQAADLTVTKTATPNPVVAGQTATFDITVKNAGDGLSSTYTLTDVLPSQFTSLAYSGALPAGCSVSPATNTLNCTSQAALAAGATRAYKITATAATPGSYTNDATVSDTSNEPTANNKGSVTGTIQPAESDLTVTKTANPTTVPIGGTATYTVTVTNSGNTTSSGYTLTDAVPSQFTNVGAPTGCTLTGNTVTCDAQPGLAAGASKSYTITAKASAQTGAFSNTAAVSNTTGEASTANNSGSASVTITDAMPDLTVTKTADKASVLPGGTVTWTVAVKNTGTAASSTYTLNDVVPYGFGTVKVTSPTTGCTVSGSSITCANQPVLAAGATATFTITAVAGSAAGSFVNTATVSGTTGELSIDNNSGDSPAVVITNPSGPGSSGGTVTTSDGYATLTKTANTYATSAGKAVTYTYTIRNTSSSYAIGGSSLSLVDDKCTNVTRGTGWDYINGSYWIPTRSTATYTCTSTLQQSTTNTATLSGMTQGYWAGFWPFQYWRTTAYTIATVKATATVNIISAGTAVPWTCTVPTVFDGYGSPTTLGTQTQGDPNFAVTPTSGTDAAGRSWTYNALAYNKSNGLLYALSNDDSDNAPRKILTIDANGVVRDTGVTVTGINDRVGNPDANVNTGFFDDAGNYYVSNGSTSGSGQLYKVNLTTGASTLVAPLPTSSYAWVDRLWANDFTYAYGYAWAIRNPYYPASSTNGTQTGFTTQKMYRVDLNTGEVKAFDITSLGLPYASNNTNYTYGAAWTYGNGNLGFDINSGGWFQVAVTNPGSTSPTFTLVANGSGPASYNNDGAACYNPLPTDLSVVKKMTSPTGAVNSGDNVTWSVVVTNNGPGVSSGFVLNDTLPTGFTPGSVTYSQIALNNTQVDGAKCTLAGSAYTCTSVGNLEVGETRTITFTAKAPTSGCFENTARITSNETDSDPNNNTNTTPQVCIAAKIDVIKTAGTVTGPDVNGVYTATYSVAVKNVGAATGQYAQVTDTPAFPDGVLVQGVSWSGGPTNEVSTPAQPDPSTVGGYLIGTTVMKSLAPGITDTYTVTVAYKLATPTTPIGTCGTAGQGLVNTVGMAQETETKDNNTACLEPPKFRIEKSAQGGPAGGTGAPVQVAPDGTVTVTYSITITNSGTVAAKHPSFTDQVSVPADFTIQQVQFGGTTQPQTNGAFTVPAGQTDLAVAGSVSYTVTVIGKAIDLATTNWTRAGTCSTGGAGAPAQGGFFNVISLGADTDGPDNNDACVPVTPPSTQIHVAKLGRCDVGASACPVTGSDFAIFVTDPSLGATPLTNGLTMDAGGSTFTSAALTFGQTYWLVETNAPTGHNLLAQPIQFRVTTQGIVLASTAASNIAVTGSDHLTITVTDTTVGELPEAGGTGHLPNLAIGLLLIAGAGLLYRRTSGARTGPAQSL